MCSIIFASRLRRIVSFFGYYVFGLVQRFKDPTHVQFHLQCVTITLSDRTCSAIGYRILQHFPGHFSPIPTPARSLGGQLSLSYHHHHHHHHHHHLTICLFVYVATQLNRRGERCDATGC